MATNAKKTVLAFKRRILLGFWSVVESLRLYALVSPWPSIVPEAGRMIRVEG